MKLRLIAAGAYVIAACATAYVLAKRNTIHVENLKHATEDNDIADQIWPSTARLAEPIHARSGFKLSNN